VEHVLAVVDFALAISKATADAGVELVRWAPELLCRHEFEVRAMGEAWRREVFRPDGYFRLREGDTHRDFFTEIDLGHVSERNFTAKLSSFSSFLTGGIYRDTYGEGAPTFLIQTTGERRMRHLLDLAADHPDLDVRGVTRSEIAANGPLARIWRTPDGQLVSLLAGPLPRPPPAPPQAPWIRAT
jgi:hypothetical protein